ncbi:choice-of-anchor F family protein [Thiomicrorhabdus sp. ZW0627]|uniref:choice-of-anchor F family protein n=1 Tax=Thiomicrorhabdus sp. ZW0627 TaxID=3039774 RepID=UPI002436E11D|nr:choice-of-anchor F family protein [Thiomicrorhabdus sp. ZW0627]MDG6773065.1 choice-of-anchor F family protein [Thiomicrorhabdus sp. ZW0627]
MQISKMFKLSMIASACLMAVPTVQAGQIVGVAQGTPSSNLTEEWKNGFGGWNLGNIEVKIVDAETGAVLNKTFNETDGSYNAMVSGDTFQSLIYDGVGSGTLMGRLTGKNWPVGEPAGIKVITTDTISNLTNGRPASCIMTTSYLSADDLSTEETNLGYTGYLDTAKPAPTLCGSPYQTHKRFKVAALPSSATLDGSKGIDIVFNVDKGVTSSAETAVRRYTVLQKLNNYTDKRLDGFKIELGFGVGADFKKITDASYADSVRTNLHLAVGDNTDADTTNNFWDLTDLAKFSTGLFGIDDKVITDPADPNYDPATADPNGFFDTRSAGYDVTLADAGTIQSVAVKTSNYPTLFGKWIPSTFVPAGIFFDHDSDATTDALLRAFWDGTQWKYGQKENFAPVPMSVLETWSLDSRYSVDRIEDLLNLGLTYMVEVGDVSALPQDTFTIRMVPIVSTDQTAPTGTTAPTDLTGYIPASGNAFSVYDNGSLLASILGFLGLGALIARRKLSK